MELSECAIRTTTRPRISLCSIRVALASPTLLSLFNHVVSKGEQRRRHGEAERLGGLQVDE